MQWTGLRLHTLLAIQASPAVSAAGIRSALVDGVGNTVPAMDALQTQDVWKKNAYDATGRYLGPIRAVAMGRDRIPRLVGVFVKGGGLIKFFSLEAPR
jgi:hypothetical protein